MSFKFWKVFDDNEFAILTASVVSMIIIATMFYHTFEGWGYIDSLYFSVTTIATVGFGDFVPTKDITKIFTVFYIILGLGEMLAFANMITKKRNEQRLRD